MALKSRATLKARFVNGFIPDQSDFADIFDSFVHKIDDEINTNVAFRGIYNASASYVPGNIVSYNGSSYINVIGCNGILPTDMGYWVSLSNKADPSPGGSGGGEAVYEEYLIGTVDQSNLIFRTSLPFEHSIQIIKNGLIQAVGPDKDFIILNSNTIRFVEPPYVGDTLIAKYERL